MLLGLLVIDQQFPLLAKPMRFVLCSPYHREDTLGLVENRVHLFERAICGLRVEKVNDRKDECIARIHCQCLSHSPFSSFNSHDGENDICLVADAGK
jgi:hypothetical protein